MEPVALLEREMYSEPEAARPLDVAPSTLQYWLEGKPGPRDKVYKPVIRTEPRGRHAAVTWAEFAEAGLLREYWRRLHVRMADLRAFIEHLCDAFGVPYPLADRRPYVSGRDIVLAVQEATKPPGELWLVTQARDQYLLTPESQSFLDRAKVERRCRGRLAARWRGLTGSHRARHPLRPAGDRRHQHSRHLGTRRRRQERRGDRPRVRAYDR